MPALDEVPDIRRPIHGEIISNAAFTKPQPLALRGRYVDLARINMDADLGYLFACGQAGDAHGLWQFMPYGPFASRAEMAAWLQRCAASIDPLWLVARARSSGSAIGMAAIMHVRQNIGVAEIGHIWFGPTHQRSRESTEAIFLLMDHVLTACGYRRLEWKCDALNARSRRAARRLGFRYEGTFYNHTIVKGRNRDTAWFSIVDSEWSLDRRRLLAWLDPMNFDETGHQTSPLREMP